MYPKGGSADYTSMAWASTEYHLRELQIALEAGHPERLLPSLPANEGRLLDIGCGAGQTLIALGLEGWTAVGLDIDLEALKLGNELMASHGRRQVSLMASSAEHLPFPEASFDMVMSRVALPYTLIPKSVAEIARVLRPGGTIWISLHPLSMFRWSNIHSLKTALYQAYVGCNTALFHFYGRQIRYPLKRSRTESYQTPAAMERCLTRNGFDRIEVLEHGAGRFVIQARKRGATLKK